jgi:hypothetical protein
MKVKLLALWLVLLLGCVSNVAGQTKHILKGTYFESQLSGQDAICNTSGCKAFSPLVPISSIVCPALANQTCTYHILAQGLLDGTLGNLILFRFFIDRAAPNPGPTYPDGTVVLFSLHHFVDDLSSSSFMSSGVSGTVTNSIDNQAHVIRVDFGCSAINTDDQGCRASAFESSVRIDVFRP